MAYPSEELERFIVRMPDGMREKLAAEAKANSRSMNAEVVQRLADSLDGGSKEAKRLRGELLASQVEAAALSLELDAREAEQGLSAEARQRVHRRAEEWKCSVAEALERIVITGSARDAQPVLIVQVAPGATVDDYQQLFAAAVKHLPAAETVVRTPGQDEADEQKRRRRLAKHQLAQEGGKKKPGGVSDTNTAAKPYKK